MMDEIARLGRAADLFRQVADSWLMEASKAETLGEWEFATSQERAALKTARLYERRIVVINEAAATVSAALS